MYPFHDEIVLPSIRVHSVEVQEAAEEGVRMGADVLWGGDDVVDDGVDDVDGVVMMVDGVVM